MYEILMDGNTLYYPGDKECTVIDPEIELKMNDSGTAKMKVPIINPYYDSIMLRNSMITVTKNDREVFYGEVRAYTGNMGQERELTAVGALSFLSNSRQPQRNWGKITPLQFLTGVLDIHNQQMFNDDRKKIYVGYVTVSNTLNAGDKITDNNSTLDAIRDNLISVHGGVLRLRHENDTLYLDYVNLNEYGEYCNQIIQLGDNIMDYTENFNAEGVKTVVIPLGARIDDDTESEFEERVDITSVNDNKNYIIGSNAAVSNYGYIWTTVTYDSISDPANLKTMGQTYLRETQFERATFKLTAVDLSAVDSSIDTMYFGDRVNIQAELFGLNATYPIVEMTMKPQNPEGERIVMSANLRSKKATLTGRVTSADRDAVLAARREAMRIESVIKSEVANIMNTFTGQNGGYKIEEYDENGLWLRTLYMDAPDKTQATNVMEFSMRGIRFSTAGYAPATSSAWKSAWTLDGKFVSQEIFSNIVFANLLKVGIIQDVAEHTYWNLENGDFVSRSSDEKLLMQQGYLRGYKREYDPSATPSPYDPDSQYINTLVGTLDLSADYGDGINRVALRSETELMLQANQNEIIVKNDETRFSKRINCENIVSGGKITCGSVVPSNGASGGTITFKQNNGLDVTLTVKNGIVTSFVKEEPAPTPT